MQYILLGRLRLSNETPKGTRGVRGHSLNDADSLTSSLLCPVTRLNLTEALKKKKGFHKPTLFFIFVVQLSVEQLVLHIFLPASIITIIIGLFSTWRTV